MALDWWSEAQKVAETTTSPVQSLNCLLRLGSIAMLQHKGWFQFPGSGDYLTNLYDSFAEVPRPYRFDQILNILCVSGLSQKSSRARQLLVKQVGHVPYVGTGLYAEPLLETPQSVIQWFFEGGGIEIARSAVFTVRRAQLRQVETAEFDVHSHDSQCGDGSRLEEIFRQMLVSKADRHGSLQDEWPSEILKSSISGLEVDPMLVQIARFRLANVGLGSQTGQQPVALPDLTQVIKEQKSKVVLPIKTAISEGPRIEFKASFEWNVRTGEKSPELRLGVLRTVAAFLNSGGGQLLIGVTDSGEYVGLAHEFEMLRTTKPTDVFESKLREAMKNDLDPVPLGKVKISFPEVADTTICQLDVEPSQEVTYLKRRDNDGRQIEEIYARDGNRTIALTGRTRDRFVLARGSI